jgi:sulfur transfer complex TusBCD TusB component (DsrH family)
MSIPDTLAYRKAELPFYSRRSEYESSSALDKYSSGIWLDGFHSVWYDEAFIQKCITENKKVCIVSEDLHARDTQAQWSSLKKWNINKYNLFSICTDFPETCKAYFNEEN